jgi:hypothetical protein
MTFVPYSKGNYMIAVIIPGKNIPPDSASFR